MEWYWILVVVLASILILLFIACVIGGIGIAKFIANPRRFTRASSFEYNHKMGYDKGTEILQRTPISFTMSDGYEIKGDYSLVEGSKLFCLLIHGHGSNREGSLRYSLIYRELGFSTVIVDQRGHGDNKPTELTLGLKESHDVYEIEEQMYKKFGSDIVLGLSGVSMGSATVLLSTRYSQKPKFIISDCGFYDLRNVIEGKIRLHHLPPKLLMPFTSFFLKKIYKFSFEDLQVGKMIKDNKIPVLFIHGDADTFINVKNAQCLYDSVDCPKKLVIFPGAYHASSISKDREKYKQEVKKFLVEEDIING